MAARIRIMIRILFGALVAWLFIGGAAMAVEEPPHTIVEKAALGQGATFELRRYAPKIVAEVTVSGDRREAANDGFRALAGYIFGDNAPKAKIAMTAPVQQSRVKGEKIAMTAPVQQAGHGDQWIVRFVMPKEYTMATLPKPTNPAIRLIEEPEQTIAAVRFSGTAGDKALADKTAALEAALAARKLTAEGAPFYAFYDPPWTLPFMRRNEVMVGVR